MAEIHEIIKYPKSRVATFDVGKIGNRKHQISGLLEIDVTEARERIQTLIKDGSEIGFISWLMRCIAGTVAETPSVHAINKGKTRQIIFDDVDISLPLERELGGRRVPLAALIKKADKKTIQEIHAEITAFHRQKVESEKDFVLGNSSVKFMNKLFFNMPQWLRMAVWKIILGNPVIRKQSMGTVIVTNAGITGNVSGWIIPKTMHNLAIGLGSINKKPWVVNNELAVREIMHLTLLFDHDAVDGAPAAKFASRLVRNIENAKWLD